MTDDSKPLPGRLFGTATVFPQSEVTIEQAAAAMGEWDGRYPEVTRTGSVGYAPSVITWHDGTIVFWQQPGDWSGEH